MVAVVNRFPSSKPLSTGIMMLCRSQFGAGRQIGLVSLQVFSFASNAVCQWSELRETLLLNRQANSNSDLFQLLKLVLAIVLSVEAADYVQTPKGNATANIAYCKNLSLLFCGNEIRNTWMSLIIICEYFYCVEVLYVIIHWNTLCKLRNFYDNFENTEVFVEGFKRLPRFIAATKFARNTFRKKY